MGHARKDTSAAVRLPEFGPGDSVRVWSRIQERDKVRLTPFEGIVMRRKGSGILESFTVRRVTFGEGVERIFPAQAPVVERVEVLSRTRAKRARLYYLRTRIGKTRFAAEQSGGAANNESQSAVKPADEPEPVPQPQAS